MRAQQKFDVKDAPVVQYIQNLLVRMVNEHASDVHFEPFANQYRIRARIDGVLHEVASPEMSMKEQLMVRLKIMAQMDIAEKRVPQDGRIKLNIDAARTVDCRVSTLPTVFGEKIVVRFLNAQNTVLDLDGLGYEPEQLRIIQNALKNPHGMILMTGPTGSGKTVSLYACLNILNKEGVNISTVEDPVEIFMHGVNQVNINEKAGIHFATALRAFLRQDPDILMVGEIRDLETADIAVKAAQTGHLVFSTLHTNDATMALTRLSQMGVSAYNVAASVNLIIAQRLVRKLCVCKQPIQLNEALLQSAGMSATQAAQVDWQAYKPVGCTHCHKTGYAGRTGVYQVLPISSAMQSLIAQNASAQALSEQAVQEGHLTLRQAGLLKVVAGVSSLEEVMSVTL
ncbi:MAG: Flp pilus assembly complex ATPase component TadA [Hydromonas sp.]|nr:Flp pilus assembly complex ATPase component TadA [Hydromonas sp.]MBP6294538.1 Flp pilus assembly complex ATPase component TadA [Hydromonas sp.]